MDLQDEIYTTVCVSYSQQTLMQNAMYYPYLLPTNYTLIFGIKDDTVYEKKKWDFLSV